MDAIKTKAMDLFQKLEDQQAEINIDFIDNLVEGKQTEEEIQRRKADKRVINEGGDFEVQVHIQELRDLVGKDLGGSSDPVVTVTIMEQKKSTKKINKQINVTLDQILFFSLTSLEPKQLLKTRCLIQVFDHNVIFPNKIIGSFEFNLGSIYYKKNHEIYNQWIGLANNESQQHDYEEDHKQEDISDTDSDRSIDNDRQQGMRTDGIQGSLKVSLNVLGANDEQFIHYENEEDEHNDGVILLPPSITQTPYKLTVKIYGYKDLAELDKDALAFMERFKHDFNYYNEKDLKLKMSSKEFINFFKALVPDKLSQESKQEKRLKEKRRLDPFFVVEFGGVRLRSIDYEDYPAFVGVTNEKVYVKFELPVMEPTYCNNIQIEFWDKDNLADNDLISVIRANYHRIKKKNMMKPHWYYMYGAPIGHEKNKYAKKMNRGFIDGTYFRGKALIEMYVTSQQQKPPPIFDVFRIKDVHIDYIDYELTCDVYQGTEIYRIAKQMFIEIVIGRQHKQILMHDIKIPPATSKRAISDKTYKREVWNINKRLKLTITDLPLDKNQWDDISLPYIFIYICTGNANKPDSIDRIAYNRISIKDIIGNQSNSSPQWYDMREDIVLDKYPKNIFPGALLISFYTDEINYNLSQSPNDIIIQTSKQKSKIKEKKNKIGPAKMIIHHMAAMHLPQTDKWGTCDPCIEFRLQQGKKLIIKKTSVIHDTLDPTWYGWDQRIEFENVNIGDKLYVLIKDDDSVVDLMPKFEKVAKISVRHLQAKNLTTDFITLRQEEDKQGIGDWMDLEIIKEKHKKQLYKGKKKKYFTNRPSIKFDIKYEYESKEDLEFLAATKSIRASKIEMQKSIEEKELENLEKSKIAKPRKMQLRADIYLGKNLRTSDLTSLCDAYLQVRFCGKTHKTTFIVDRSDPQWFQTLIIENINVPWPLKYAPSIYCEVYDKNFINKDEPIGRFEEIAKHIYSPKERKMDNNSAAPILYHLKHSENDTRVEGEILARFELTNDLDDKFENEMVGITKPDLRLHSIHIIVLGLRDITSLLGVHECYIQFELGGKKYRSRKSNYPEPWNANYCEIIHFDVELPEDIMFLPNLNIYVIDSLFGGLIERNIGYASIQVAELMRTEEQRITFLTKQQTEQMIEFKENESKKQLELLHVHDTSDNSLDDIDIDDESDTPLLKDKNKDKNNHKTGYNISLNVFDKSKEKLYVETK
eukprot:98268_1